MRPLNFEATEALVSRHRPSLDRADVAGWTALHVAARMSRCSIVVLLLKVGKCLDYNSAHSRHELNRDPSRSEFVCLDALHRVLYFFLCSNTPVLLCSSLSCMFFVSPCECSFFCCTLSLSQFSHFRYLRFAVRKLWRLEHLWRRGTAMENSLRTCVWMRQRMQHFHLIRITCSLHRDLLGISTLDLMRKMPRPTTKKVGCVYCSD